MEEITKKYLLFFEFIHNNISYFSYYELCSEILSSVKKMEDSMQRLRRVRESSKALPTMTQSMPAPGTDSMTDDNKIRMQIQYDVNAFTSEVILFCHFCHLFFLVGFIFSLKNLVLILHHRIN
jgi:hypothetical protein